MNAPIMINGINVDFISENGTIFCDSLKIAEVFEKKTRQYFKGN